MRDEKVYVRVTRAEDGKTPVRELMVHGVKAETLTFVEAITLAMQIVSTLRWEKQ